MNQILPTPPSIGQLARVHTAELRILNAELSSRSCGYALHELRLNFWSKLLRARAGCDACDHAEDSELHEATAGGIAVFGAAFTAARAVSSRSAALCAGAPLAADVTS